jgi:hypothetical protein
MDRKKVDLNNLKVEPTISNKKPEPILEEKKKTKERKPYTRTPKMDLNTIFSEENLDEVITWAKSLDASKYGTLSSTIKQLQRYNKNHQVIKAIRLFKRFLEYKKKKTKA